MKAKTFTQIITTESVSAGHPDKVADQIAELFLDFFMELDQDVKVACEVFVNKHKITIGGELSSRLFKFNVHHEKILKKKIFTFLTKGIGYSEQSWQGLSPGKLDIEFLINVQSQEINSLLVKADHHLGAGDNSTVFGYATNTPQTNYYPPLQYLANKILQTIDAIRKNKSNATLQAQMAFAPDGKIQIAFLPTDQKEIVKITLCQQFLLKGAVAQKREIIKKEIITPLLAELGFNTTFDFQLIPFVLGGPAADSGITGRKILIDNYGVFAYNGGGSIAGKDPSKSDRSLVYFSRYIAKHLVALNLGLEEITIQTSTIIGDSDLVNITFLPSSPASSSKFPLALKILIDEIITTFFAWSFDQILANLKLKAKGTTYLPFSKYSYLNYKSAPWEELSLLPKIKAHFGSALQRISKKG